MNLIDRQTRASLADVYRTTLLDDVIPFWLQHGIDRAFGGYLTCLDRDGTVIDTDKSIWFQGRGAWMFATLYNTVEPKSQWLEAAESGIRFLRQFGRSPSGKLYFSVTQAGQPLRLRRYVYSESFAAIANAAYAKATGDQQAHSEALTYFSTYLRHSFEPGLMPAKVDSHTRPTQGLGPLMITIATAQEIRSNLGDIVVHDRTCSEWIGWAIGKIQAHFLKPELRAVLEVAGPHGEVLDHFDGRLLNPGHAIECAWFILHEAKRQSSADLIQLGCQILDWMWERGWDEQYGGLLYFRDLHHRPIQEYWHDMKFWWPHCEAIIATCLAWQLTADEKYARWNQQVHDWSFTHFPDREFGEWYGYLHRDGRLSTSLKGNLWKGPFHLPRMLWYCWRLLEEAK